MKLAVLVMLPPAIEDVIVSYEALTVKVRIPLVSRLLAGLSPVKYLLTKA
jgi:hypothetical protein